MPRGSSAVIRSACSRVKAIDAKARSAFSTNDAETVGEDAEADGEQRFDLTSASETLAFVRAVDVPAPEISAGATPYVTDVRFRSNINTACAEKSCERVNVLGRIASVSREV